MLSLLIFLVPVFAVVSGLYLYRHTGKRELLKFDLVQFIYAFILAPISYLWMKSFLFVFLVRELNLTLTITDIFIADAAYTVIFLYFYAFLVIHSLTKSFELKRSSDPLHDIFKHSEFFHLLTSHVVLYVGAAVLLFIPAVINVFFQFNIAYNQAFFYLVLVAGAFTGLTVHVWIINTDDEFDVLYPRFEKFIEFVYASFFILLLVVYFLFRPDYSMEYFMYWFMFMFFGGFVVASLTLERSERLVRVLKKFHYKAPRLTDPLVKKKK